MNKIISFLLIICSITLLSVSCQHTLQNKPDTESKITQLISKLTLEEKIKMLGGTGFDTPEIQRLNIPALRMTDGPAGVRWGTATAFPGPISLAASWNRDLVFRVAQAMAEEVKLKNKNVLLAPCVNIHRFPLGGRNFESYGEDPYLTGQTAVAFIRGIQDKHVVATVKHFAANNQEWERAKVNIKIDERTLREIYLPAFRAAVQDGGVFSVMAAYNKLNGYYCTENKHLLTDILKNEWGFDGYVVSDWGATHNTVRAANAGLDIEMPYDKHFGDSLLTAVRKGEVSEQTIDDKVSRILRVMFKAGLMDTLHRNPVDEKEVYKTHKSLALEAAEKGIVLLKNSDSLLPLQKENIKTIAVVGPNAAYAISGGGGSSQVHPLYKVSPLESILHYVGDDVEVLYASGLAMDGDILPVEPQFLFTPNKKSQGLQGDYFQSTDFSGDPVFTRTDEQITFNFGYDAPKYEMNAIDDGNRYGIRWTGFLKAPRTGIYELLLLSDGGARVFVDGNQVIDDTDNKRVKLRTVRVFLEKGKFTPVKIEYVSWWSVSEVKFGWRIPDFDPVQQAVKLAEKADVTILVTGLSNHFESESGDLKRFTFPQQDTFINAVLDANPNTVVVMYNGSPYSIKEWAGKAKAIVEAWYGGQEQGNALAKVLFGDYNPSGKLPFSFISDSTDCPAFEGYRNNDLEAGYSEGIFVGYRYLDKENISPVFPFGHGLSYTTFAYSNMNVEVKNDSTAVVTLTIKNTGKRTGTETAQIYISDTESSVSRPVKELKGFWQVTLKPGEEKVLEITLNKEPFAFYDNTENRWTVEPGIFIIMAGSSSGDIRIQKEVVL